MFTHLLYVRQFHQKFTLKKKKKKNSPPWEFKSRIPCLPLNMSHFKRSLGIDLWEESLSDLPCAQLAAPSSARAQRGCYPPGLIRGISLGDSQVTLLSCFPLLQGCHVRHPRLREMTPEENDIFLQLLSLGYFCF